MPRLAAIRTSASRRATSCRSARDAIRAAGIEVVVAGKRYGKGSSREHSVVAEQSAGVRLVIAESFERIYRQNADSVGLFTSTDFSLIDRIERGEAIPIEALQAGRDALTASILRHRGLLAYGRARLGPGRVERRFPPAQLPPSSEADAALPRTLFEKIIARHALATVDTPARPAAGQGAFVRADWRFIHEYYTGLCASMLDRAFGPGLALFEPETIVAFEDHLSYVHRSPVHVRDGLVPNVRGLSDAHRAFVARHRLTEHGYQQPHLEAGDPGNAGSQGISHAVMAERYALPGQVVVGTDSHTPHSGALGCVAFGVGTTDMANAFVTGGDSHHDSRGPAGRVRRHAAARHDREGPRAASAGRARDPRRRGRRQGLRVRRSRDRRDVDRRTRDADQHDGGTRRLHRHGRARCRNRAVPARTPGRRLRARALDEERSRRPVCADDPHRLRGAHPDGRRARRSRQRSSRSRRCRHDRASTLPTAVRAPRASATTSITITRCSTGPPSADSGCPTHVRLYLQFGTVAVRDYCIERGYLRAFAGGRRGESCSPHAERARTADRARRPRPTRSRSAPSTAIFPDAPARDRSGSRVRLPSPRVRLRAKSCRSRNCRNDAAGVGSTSGGPRSRSRHQATQLGRTFRRSGRPEADGCLASIRCPLPVVHGAPRSPWRTRALSAPARAGRAGATAARAAPPRNRRPPAARRPSAIARPRRPQACGASSRARDPCRAG